MRLCLFPIYPGETNMPTKKSAAKAKTPPTPPSTVLTISLHPNGTGQLVATRGDLAHLSQFTYKDMQGIVAALQNGAAKLIDVEKNPPPKTFPTSANPTPAPVAASPSEVEETTQEDET